MKKNFLGVCLCLLMAASMGMAAGYDEIMDQGTDWYTLFAMIDDFETQHEAAQLDNPSLPNHWGVFEPLSFDNRVWDPESAYNPYDEDRSWDFLIIAWYDIELGFFEGEVEWYAFEKDYSVEDFDSFLTLPFSPSDRGFSLALGYNLGKISEFIGGGVDPEVPEPGTLLLLGTGIVGLGLVVKRRKMKK